MGSGRSRSGSRQALNITSIPGATRSYWFDSDHSVTSEELLSKARLNLRCIDWENMTLELILSAKGALEGQDLFTLSRRVEDNETIDFFLSHSW